MKARARFSALTLLLLLIIAALPNDLAAEWYVAGYGGYSMPQSLKDVTMNTLGERIALSDQPTGFGQFVCPPTCVNPLGQVTQNFQTSDISLKNSAIFGGKAGYFFKDEGFSWLGVEVEAFTSTPTIKNQTITTAQGMVYTPFNPAVVPPGGTCPVVGTCAVSTFQQGTLQLTESKMRLIAVAFNVVARYPGQIFRPYAGVGGGAFYFSSTGQIDGSQVVPGLNVMAGLKILFTEEFGIFAEGKYNLATISNLDPTFGLSGQYSAFNVVGGLAYHF